MRVLSNNIRDLLIESVSGVAPLTPPVIAFMAQVGQIVALNREVTRGGPTRLWLLAIRPMW